MAPKSSKAPAEKFDISDYPDLNYGPVLVLNDHLLDKKIHSMKFQHPKTGLLQTFLLCPETHQIFELFKFDDQYRSWMIEDFILKDGGMYILTEVNPLFLLLPSLLKNETKYMELSSLLHDGHGVDNDTDNAHAEDDDDDDENGHFDECYLKNIHHITLFKEVHGSKFYKLDSAKTLEWLKKKVAMLSDKLQGNVTASVLPGFEASIDCKDNSEGNSRSAWELLSQYLPPQLSEQLRIALNLKKADVEKQCNDEDNQEPSKKKLKVEGPTTDYSTTNAPPPKRPTKLTAAQRSLSKGEKEGLRSISTFFTKPLKK